MYKYFFVIIFTASLSWSSFATEDEDVLAAVIVLNNASLDFLGVSLSALSFLSETSPHSYRPLSYLKKSGKIELINELEKAGYLEVSSRTGLPDGQEPNEKFIITSPSEAGILLIASIKSQSYNNTLKFAPAKETASTGLPSAAL